MNLSLFDALEDPKPQPNIASDLPQTRVPTAVLAALRRATITHRAGEATLDFPPIAAATYAAAKPVFESCGFVWISARKTHVGTDADAEALADVIERGTFFDSKREREFFATSKAGAATLARILVDDLWMDEPNVLEPSAGEGALIDALLLVAPQIKITGVEIDPRRAAILCKRYAADPRVRIVESDILAFNERGFDAAIMNPPFEHAAAHLQHVYGLLRGNRTIIGIAQLARAQDRELAGWLHDRDAWRDETNDDTFADTKVKASFFGLTTGPSLLDTLIDALKPHPSLQMPQIRHLTELSRDILQIAVDDCNGVRERDENDTGSEVLLDEARRLVEPEDIRILRMGDVRGGHGFKLVLPSGHTNDWGQTGIIVPPARAVEKTARRRHKTSTSQPALLSAIA